VYISRRVQYSTARLKFSVFCSNCTPLCTVSSLSRQTLLNSIHTVQVGTFKTVRRRSPIPRFPIQRRISWNRVQERSYFEASYSTVCISISRVQGTSLDSKINTRRVSPMTPQDQSSEMGSYSGFSIPGTIPVKIQL
jgi:hypothetical protein